MPGSLNEVSLIGHVASDVDIRHTQTGKAIANFTVATNETWKDKNTGERKENAQFHRCVCFNDGLVNVLQNYVKKGSYLFVRGALQTRKWQDKDGHDRYTTEVVLSGFNCALTMLDKRDDTSQEQTAPPQDTENGPDFDDSIPF